MPVIEHRKIDRDAQIGIWNITEEVDELMVAMGLSGEDEMALSAFATEQRKKQWLAYRLLIKHLLPEISFTIYYDEHGKPHLSGTGHQLSVTHTSNYAAVILSSTQKAGIDIEMVRSRIERVSTRFLSPVELSGIGDNERLEKLTVYWSVKEALYKLFGRRKLDFIRHIWVPDFSLEKEGSFEAGIKTGNFDRTYPIHYEFMANMVMVYVLGDNMPGYG